MKLTQKVMEVKDGQNWFKVIKHLNDEKTPYRVYRCWYDRGEHKQQTAKCSTLKKAISELYYSVDRKFL